VGESGCTILSRGLASALEAARDAVVVWLARGDYSAPLRGVIADEGLVPGVARNNALMSVDTVAETEARAASAAARQRDEFGTSR
jgi:hypothetical protein